MSSTGSSSSIIAQLLEMMPKSVREASDEDLLEAFLNMDAEQEVRDTSQALLEARKYLRQHPDLLPENTEITGR